MMKKMELPELKFVELTAEDVIATSDPVNCEKYCAWVCDNEYNGSCYFVCEEYGNGGHYEELF